MSVKIIATNRKAYHNYTIEDKLEAGIMLLGSEIKSIRNGQINLKESYASFQGDELWLLNSHISHYKPANRENHDPLRPRKLLLHRRELNKLMGKLQEKGLTLVPLKLYLKNGLAKVELGVGRGKRKYDKRQALKAKDDNRQIQRALRQHQKDGY